VFFGLFRLWSAVEFFFLVLFFWTFSNCVGAVEFFSGFFLGFFRLWGAIEFFLWVFFFWIFSDCVGAVEFFSWFFFLKLFRLKVDQIANTRRDLGFKAVVRQEHISESG
jgi:hypothetical protein